MPYIPEDEREDLEECIENLVDTIHHIIDDKGLDLRDADGRLNYTICELLMRVFELNTDPRYTKLNTAFGVLDCVARELYRRVAVPYEGEAIVKSGRDIPSFEKFEKWLFAVKTKHES